MIGSSDADLVDAISAECVTVINALAREYELIFSLTGGQDSRALLACVRKTASSIHFVTYAFPPPRRDVHIATKIADKFGLNLSIIQPVLANEDEVESSSIGSGHSLAGNDKPYFPTTVALKGRMFIGGGGGDARGFLWDKNVRAPDPISAIELLARLKLSPNERNKTVLLAWLDALPPGLSAYQILDLAYIELRMASWAYAQPMMAHSPRRMSPLNSFPQFRRFASLSPKFEETIKSCHWL